MTLLPTIRPPTEALERVRPTYWQAIIEVAAASVPAHTSHRRKMVQVQPLRRTIRRARRPPMVMVSAPNKNGLAPPIPSLMTTYWEPYSRLAARLMITAVCFPALLSTTAPLTTPTTLPERIKPLPAHILSRTLLRNGFRPQENK